MIVTIDGPAGAGKSSAARQLAARLGFNFLDTGAMYRAVALLITRKGIHPDDENRVQAAIASIEFRIANNRLFCLDEDVTDLVREQSIAQTASIIATIPAVREKLVQWQRIIVDTGDFVCEGRDQGTVAFPNADCKIYLTADPEVRAERRWQELCRAGEHHELEQVVAEQKIRDLRDETRAVGRLQKAEDAIVLNADRQTLDQIVDQLEQIAKRVLLEHKS